MEEGAERHVIAREEGEVVGGGEVVAAQDAEVLGVHEDRGIGGAFGVDAADGDAEHGAQNLGLVRAWTAKRSQSFWAGGVQAASATAARRGKTRSLK